jgi:hypothetical protein
VSKKKNTMALYEVISNAPERRRASGLTVPNWMGEEGEAPGEPPEAPPPVPGEEAPRPPRPAPEPTHRTAFPLSQGEPVLGRSGDRWNFSLSLRACAVVLGGLLVALVLVFLLGRWSRGGGSAEETVLVNPRPAPPAQRAAGKMYPVIVNLGEGFRPSGSSSVLTPQGQELVKQANEIVGFCRSRNYRATINKWRGKYVIVWSLDGFDDPNGDEAKAFVAELETLGKENVDLGGKWEFPQSNPTFLPQ